MANKDQDKSEKDGESGPPPEAARYPVTEEDKAKARRWFARAKELTEGKNFDYAIQCYVDGLAHWPEAVEEGHQLLRLAASERNLRGGKKPGFADTMKRSMSGKDAKKAMLNAEWLLSQDPQNISYIEGLFKNANKLHCEDTLKWIGPIYTNACEAEKKLSPKRFALMREVYEEAGDRAAARGEGAIAVEFYELAAAALRTQSHVDPKDRSLENELRDLSTKLTILKGRYGTADTFLESMQDADDQKAIHDQDRKVQSGDDLANLVQRAEKDLEGTPDNPAKIERLVELLCRDEKPENETRAVRILVEKFKAYGDFRLKARAEDIRIKQLRRAVRKARAAKDPAAAKAARIAQLTFEIKSYRERVKQYPTDNKLKFHLATCLFEGGKHDEAIPLFQTSRADPKVRTQADLHLGRCFYAKKFFAQAIGLLTQAVASHEMPDDAVAKELRYWLARSLEAEKRGDEAKKAYGELLQTDYNFRDVRDRLQALTNAETT